MPLRKSGPAKERKGEGDEVEASESEKLLHLLKQYNNSFLSHPLSKIFYLDGRPQHRGATGCSSIQTQVKLLASLLETPARYIYELVLPNADDWT